MIAAASLLLGWCMLLCFVRLWATLGFLVFVMIFASTSTRTMCDRFPIMYRYCTYSYSPPSSSKFRSASPFHSENSNTGSIFNIYKICWCFCHAIWCISPPKICNFEQQTHRLWTNRSLQFHNFYKLWQKRLASKAIASIRHASLSQQNRKKSNKACSSFDYCGNENFGVVNSVVANQFPNSPTITDAFA